MICDMDFFEEQEQARKQSRVLLFCFSLAAVAVMLSACVVLVVAAHMAGGAAGHWVRTGQVLSIAGLAALLLIGFGALFSLWSLRQGGASIVSLLRGLAVSPDSSDPDEQRLLNVVEEMAIASGIPVPPVYVLKMQSSINAFAAGYSPEDAVIGVTQGALKLLSRDEMQGVVAHEFSHIFNGDMRLNLTATALLHGLSLFWNVGRTLIESGMPPRPEPDGSNAPVDKGNVLLVIAGGALMTAGSPGYIFGRIIRATLSQEREILADAAAVQFTRNPAGLAGALKKIGGLSEAGTIRSVYAGVLNHFFFARAESAASGMLASHPPLSERIRALDPDFDGTWPEVSPLEIREASFELKARDEAVRQISAELEQPVALGLDQPRIALAAGDLTAAVGRAGSEHLLYASKLIEKLPVGFFAHARDSRGAPAIIYGLLLSMSDDRQAREGGELRRMVGEEQAARTMKLLTALQSLRPEQVLPLVDLCVPALRKLSMPALEELAGNVERLCSEYHKDDLRAGLIKYLLKSRLGCVAVSEGGRSSGSGDNEAVRKLLALLAQAGNETVAGRLEAFAAGAAAVLPAKERTAGELLTSVSLSDLDAVLPELARTNYLFRKKLLCACLACISEDNFVTVGEAEMLRLIALALACPLPPMANGVV